MAIKRSTAKKTRIVDIIHGKFFPGNKEEMKPSYIITPFGEKLSRVNLIATATEKFLSEDENYSAITVDDGTAAIRFKTFRDDIRILDGIEVGDLVLVIGKVKEYNSEIYINGEIVRKLDNPNFENLRKLEILQKLVKLKAIAEEIKNLSNELSEEELKSYAKEKNIDDESLQVILDSKKIEIDYKPKILGLIESLDDGDGVEIGKIMELSQLPENVIESAINELLNSGTLYEPTVGKLKKV